MQKRIAIKVLNFYGINPADSNKTNTINYKQIRKIKVDKLAIKEKRIIEKLKGEEHMNNTQLSDEVNMSILDKERKMLEDKQRELKEEMDAVKPDMAKYKKAKEAENPTATQKTIIDDYIQYDKLRKLVEQIESDLKLLDPFLVACDAGKYNTKSFYIKMGLNNEEMVVTKLFPSKVERASECQHDNGVKFFVDNEVYALSSAKRVSDDKAVRNPEIEKMVNTKAHEYHRILMLKSLYKIHLETGRRVFNVVVGTSLDNYWEDEGARVYLTMLDEKLPPELEDKILACSSPDEEHEIYKGYVETLKSKYTSKSFVVRETGKEPVTLIINDLHVTPETITGATKVDTDDLEHAIVCDFGGLNESYLPIVNYSPVFSSLISNKHGMVDKYKKIAQWIETRTSEISIDGASIEVMLNNYDKIDEKMNHLIKSALFHMFDEMLEKLRKNSVSYQKGITSIICIGGGAQVLSPYLKEYFSTVEDIGKKLYIADSDGIYANVSGMYDSGEVYFDQREYQRKLLKTT